MAPRGLEVSRELLLTGLSLAGQGPWKQRP